MQESEEQRRKRLTLEKQEATSKAWLTLVALISRLSFLADRVQASTPLSHCERRYGGGRASRAWLPLTPGIRSYELADYFMVHPGLSRTVARVVQVHRVAEFKRRRMMRAARVIQTAYRASRVMRLQERRNRSALVIQR